MPAFIDENTQFVDSGGIPLAGGKIFIGVKNQDPVLNPEPIFSDRALQNALLNPQTLNAEGRSTNKIWIAAEYSLLVQDINGFQHLLELDQGEPPASGNVKLTVTGTETLIGTASPGISALVNNTLYIFQAVGANDGNMTLDIDGTGAKSILQNVNQQIQKNKVQDKQMMILSFNESEDFFSWVNHSDKVIYLTKATDINSTATTDIWVSLGNYVAITGTAVITSLGTAPQAGSFRIIRADGAFTLTENASIILPGGKDIVAAIGDTFKVIADTTTIARVVQYQKIGQSPASDTFVTLSTDTDTANITLLSNLPNNVVEIYIQVNGWSSTIGNQQPKIVLGDSGGFETTGYVSTGQTTSQLSTIIETSTSGFLIGDGAQYGSGDNNDFICVLRLHGGNVWSYQATGGRAGLLAFQFGTGHKTLSPGPLTQVRLTTTGGTALQDGGTAFIRFR